jgi:signal transduction histidine kinase
MTTSQINLLKDTAAAQFQTIALSVTRDMAALYGRSTDEASFADGVHAIVRGYERFYARQGVHVSVSGPTNTVRPAQISIVDEVIHIGGSLPEPFENFILAYRKAINTRLDEMRGIQRSLLVVAVVFAIAAAAALYFILEFIFRSLSADFNRMARTIENQMRDKQQFVDNFSHEIRTPLTSIYGYAQYMQQARLGEEEIIEATGQIMTEATHMNRIANSLLELATLRGYVPVRERISVPKLFEDIRQTLEARLIERGAELFFECDDETIRGQEDLIRSLLLNLCANALNACVLNEGKIFLAAKGCVISVSDNGCGISAENISKVCEPFYRADKSRTRGSASGTGLGLALCKQIAEAHGAELSVKSELGVGTEISVNFTTS